MEWSNSDSDMLFDGLETGATAELTNLRSLPASMTYGTVAELESNERVVCERDEVVTYEVCTSSL